MHIVCVRQGFELYGSDGAFIDSAAASRNAWPLAEIEVILPRNGPITAPLRAFATRIVVEPLFILRRRDIVSLAISAPFRIMSALWRVARRVRTANIVDVNTVVVLDYLIAASAACSVSRAR